MRFEKFQGESSIEELTYDENTARLEMIAFLVHEDLQPGESLDSNRWAENNYISFERAFDQVRQNNPEVCIQWEMGEEEIKQDILTRIKIAMKEFPAQSEAIEIKKAA